MRPLRYGAWLSQLLRARRSAVLRARLPPSLLSSVRPLRAPSVGPVRDRPRPHLAPRVLPVLGVRRTIRRGRIPRARGEALLLQVLFKSVRPALRRMPGSHRQRALRLRPRLPVAPGVLRLLGGVLQEALLRGELLRDRREALLRGALPHPQGIAVRGMREGDHRKVKGKNKLLSLEILLMLLLSLTMLL